MSGITLRYSLDDASARASLRGARDRGLDLRPGWRAVGQAGVGQTRRRFLTGIGPDGTPWKKGHKPSGMTLIASGLLLRSIRVAKVAQDGVEWGSNRIYAAIHQLGGVIRPINGKALHFKIAGGFITAKSVTIPARPYLGANQQDLTAFAQILLRHIAGPIGEAG
ncbi:phage virion morphogenesis protein [Phenylobacterium sp.]|uniref:phage virion morphogenesis protein n=2 Tax=Phenylobacterium sp. TaxID=1871053 RepID=UPI00272FCED5|nr:phage virion morphogenesis protein [Phenylobacterium sp.]MDP1617340.1 phage virion morphogenesis protein [Phenylobacterium sp.]